MRVPHFIVPSSVVPFARRIPGAAVVPFGAINRGTRWFAHEMLNDPEIGYGFDNEYALRSLGNPSFAAPFTQTHMNVRDLPPDRLATLLSVLAGYRGIPPDRMSWSDLQMLALRALNPRNVRLGP